MGKNNTVNLLKSMKKIYRTIIPNHKIQKRHSSNQNQKPVPRDYVIRENQPIKSIESIITGPPYWRKKIYTFCHNMLPWRLKITTSSIDQWRHLHFYQRYHGYQGQCQDFDLLTFLHSFGRQNGVWAIIIWKRCKIHDLERKTSGLLACLLLKPHWHFKQ